MRAIILALLLSSNLAWAETPCDEWANFSKIIAYRMRDGIADIEAQPRDKVKAEIMNPKYNIPEKEHALDLVDYVYDHPDTSPVQIWKDIYTQCVGKPTL